MKEPNLDQKLIAAYDNMMARVAKLIDTAEQQALPALQKNIEKAKQQAIELKEITQEESEKLAFYTMLPNILNKQVMNYLHG